jgi:hypothetical protein
MDEAGARVDCMPDCHIDGDFSSLRPAPERFRPPAGPQDTTIASLRMPSTQSSRHVAARPEARRFGGNRNHNADLHHSTSVHSRECERSQTHAPDWMAILTPHLFDDWANFSRRPATHRAEKPACWRAPNGLRTAAVLHGLKKIAPRLLGRRSRFASRPSAVPSLRPVHLPGIAPGL